MSFQGNGPFNVTCITLAHVINATDYSRLSEVATLDTAPGHVYRLPWETGWAGVVLGGSCGSRGHLTVQGLPPLKPRLKRLPEPIADSSFSRCVVHRLHFQGDDALSEDVRKAIAVESWRLVANLFPASCATGCQVVEDELALDPDASVHELIGDILAAEAAGILELQAGCLLQYFARHRSGRADNALPVHEEIDYEYLKHLRKESAVASARET